jgi:hypothetical protein
MDRLRTRGLAGALIGALVVVLVGTAFAVGRSSIQATASASMGAKKIATATGEDFPATQSSQVQIPGATVTIVIPSYRTGILVARFSGQSTCTGDAPGMSCQVRLRYRKNGTGQFQRFLPSGGGWKAFDSPSGPNDGRESHATEWVSGVLSAGSYEIIAEAGVQDVGDMTFDVDFWTLVAEWWRTT